MKTVAVLVRYALGLCLLTTAISPAAIAQQGPDEVPPVRERSNPEQELKQLDRALKLSPEQRDRIFVILRGRDGAIDRLLADETLPMREKFPRILEIRDRANDQIRAMLVPPQQKRFDRMVADEKRRRETGPEDGPPGDMPPPPPQ